MIDLVYFRAQNNESLLVIMVNTDTKLTYLKQKFITTYNVNILILERRTQRTPEGGGVTFSSRRGYS